MKKFLIGAAVLCIGLPAAAQVKAEFDPGQYTYTIEATVAGTVADSQTQSDCMTTADSSIGARELEMAMPGEVSCSYSNVNSRLGKVTSNYSCFLTDMGVTYAGTADVNWTRTNFDVKLTGNMQGEGMPGNGVPMNMTIQGQRTGSCS